MVAIRCQAVDVARNISTVWRAVATGERWLRESGEADGSHPLPSGGCGQEYFHRLASGGYGRAVATGERWLRASGEADGSHPLPSGGCC
jgi:hypothetical protein